MNDLGESVSADIAARGFAHVAGDRYRDRELEGAFGALAGDWDQLEVDRYMPDGSTYRRRRYGRFFFIPATGDLVRLPHATVFQSRYINGFAGGLHRDFAPLRDSTFENPYVRRLIATDFSPFTASAAGMLEDAWEVWVHQIRITTAAQLVPPAPEGIHHDGHDFIAMHLMKRDNIEGGGSTIYDNDQSPLYSCMLEGAMDTLYADDRRVMHAVDPVCPADPSRPATRDIFIIDFDHRPRLERPR